MNRTNEARLRKLEDISEPGCSNLVLIAFGPDETVAHAAERHFERRPEDRTAERITFVHTGVTRSEVYA